MDNKFECSLCLEDFKDPRILSCFHTYCRNCLDKYVQKSSRTANSVVTFDCPICRTSVTLPERGVDGLQKNFYLVEETKSKSSYPMCQLHSNEDLRFYCRNCAEPVCRDCKVVAHDGHSITMIDNAVAEMKLKLKELLDDTEKCINENEIKQRSLIESDVHSLETAIADITKYTEEMNKEIQDLLSYANMKVVVPRIQTKQGKVLSIQSQCDQKIKKLNQYQKAFTVADTQNDSRSKLKVFKELIKREEHIKLLKHPARVSNDGEVIKDSFVTSRLKFAFNLLRDTVHQGCLQVQNTYFTHKGKPFSDESTSQSAKRQPSPMPCPTLPKRPRSSSMDSTRTETTADNRQQTPQRSIPVQTLVSACQTKQFQPQAIATMQIASNVGSTTVKPVQEVKPQTEIVSESRLPVASRAHETMPSISKDSVHSASRQSISKPSVDFSNNIEAYRVNLASGRTFQEGEFYVVKDKLGRERKMVFSGGGLVESPHSQGHKTAVTGSVGAVPVQRQLVRVNGQNVGTVQGRVIAATVTRPSDTTEKPDSKPAS